MASFQLPVSHKTFQVFDGDRFVQICPSTIRFARPNAYATQGARETSHVPYHIEGLVELVLPDILHIGRNVEVGRTGIGARGHRLCLVGSGGNTLFLFDEVNKFVFEILKAIKQSGSAGLTNLALGAFPDHAPDGLHRIQVGPGSPATGDLLEKCQDYPGSHPAGNAFPAGLSLNGFHICSAHIHDINIGIPDCQAIPTHEGLDPILPVILEGNIQSWSLCEFLLRFSAIVNNLSLPAGKNNIGHDAPSMSFLGSFQIDFFRSRQRSISPRTISIDPMVATTSAIIWPSTILGSALRLAKLGVLTLKRYGLLPPLLMM